MRLRAGNMPPRSLAPAYRASKTAPAAHEFVVGLGVAQRDGLVLRLRRVREEVDARDRVPRRRV